MEDLYARQEPLELDVPTTVTVVGCGGIGSWVAIFAAMSGVKKLLLFDDDVIEESNRNRLPFCQGSVNRPKVEVVAEFIYAIRPEIEVIAVKEKLAGGLVALVLQESSCVIECTDSPRNQAELYKACKEALKDFIRVGYDGTHITITSIVNGWIRTDETENYTIQPSWVVPASIAAALAVSKLCKYPTQEVSLDISEIGIPMLRRKTRKTPSCRGIRR